MLTQQQIRCIENLCVGTKTIQEIANEIGCSSRAIYSWKSENEEFKAELQKRSHDFETGLLDNAKSLLAKTLGQSIDNVIKIANDYKEDAETRLKANKYIIDKIIPDAKVVQDAKEIEIPVKVENINELAARIKEKQKKKRA